MDTCGHDRTNGDGATSVEGMTPDEMCGASDLMISLRQYRDRPLFCTLPSGHPMWTVNPATGYSYQHHDASHGEWWNGPGIKTPPARETTTEGGP